MPVNEYASGRTVRCSARFTSAGVAVDPTTVTFKSKTPGGTITTYVYGVDGALIRSSAGNYYVDVVGNAAGAWHYRWQTTGEIDASEHYFIVLPSPFS
jgi:hypothetical protein